MILNLCNLLLYNNTLNITLIIKITNIIVVAIAAGPWEICPFMLLACFFSAHILIVAIHDSVIILALAVDSRVVLQEAHERLSTYYRFALRCWQTVCGKGFSVSKSLQTWKAASDARVSALCREILPSLAANVLS